MYIPFIKMQAQGNDFVILDALSKVSVTWLARLDKDFITTICHRHLGIGCDQLLLLTPHEQADTLMLIYNADGSEAENCGNGLRCVADLLMKKLKKEHVSIALADRVVTTKHTNYGVCVSMGKAEIERVAEHHIDVNIGNPHRVYFDEHAESCPERNVEIVSHYDGQQVKVRIIERGSGETAACGSGACATAVAVWYRQANPKEAVLNIQMPGGEVRVSIRDGLLYLEGEVSMVYQGSYFYSC